MTFYCRSDNVLAAWNQLQTASTAIYNKLPSATKPAFFQLVHHPVLASANLGNMLIAAGKNNLRASQARLSANTLADQVETLFEHDFDLEAQYHSLLDGESLILFPPAVLTFCIKGKWDQCVVVSFRVPFKFNSTSA
jgi:hypothetical protein